MKAGKKDGPRPTVKDKMRKAYREMTGKARQEMDSKPARKGGCDCCGK